MYKSLMYLIQAGKGNQVNLFCEVMTHQLVSTVKLPPTGHVNEFDSVFGLGGLFLFELVCRFVFLS